MDHNGPDKNDKSWWDTAKEWGKPMVSGAVSGAATGGLGGSFFAGVGAIPGAIGGAVLGGVGGLLGHQVDKSVESRSGQSVSSMIAPQGFNDATGGALPMLMGALSGPVAVGGLLLANQMKGESSGGTPASPSLPSVEVSPPTVEVPTPSVPAVEVPTPSVEVPAPTVDPTPGVSGLTAMNNVVQAEGLKAQLIDSVAPHGSGLSPVLKGISKVASGLDVAKTVYDNVGNEPGEAALNIGCKLATTGLGIAVPPIGVAETVFDIASSTVGGPTSDEVLKNVLVSGGKFIAEHSAEEIVGIL